MLTATGANTNTFMHTHLVERSRMHSAAPFTSNVLPLLPCWEARTDMDLRSRSNSSRLWTDILRAHNCVCVCVCACACILLHVCVCVFKYVRAAIEG